MKRGRNQNLTLITQLIGQICFNKHETIYWSRIGQKVLENSNADLIWRKIGRRLIRQQNSLYLECLLRQLLMNAASDEQVEWYLGNLNEQENRSTITHLLTNKFLLINFYSTFQNQNLIENIIGYLANFSLNLFEQTFCKVLSVWSNATLVRHQTKDQHYYLCRILICCLKNAIKLEFKLDANQMLQLILRSAEMHLKMVELEKRNTGLFVIEQLMNYLNEDKDKLDGKLSFEIKLNDEIRFLSKILDENFREEDRNVKEDKEELKEEFDYIINNEEEDDLKPYDMSNDLPMIKTKKPIYLKDCLDGLMNAEDSEFNRTCLECLFDLIDKNRYQAVELSVDFMRVLLFLDNEDEELKEIRLKAMIKFCNLNPLSSAQFLTSQIYEQNLSIVRKLEVLDVLIESGKQLSSAKSSIEDNKIKSIQNIVRHQKPEYERIIEERLKLKTRYLCPISSSKSAISFKNEFTQYVNHYFYPLINNYDKKDITLKFNEDDYFVLGKLLQALAELLKCVSQTHLTHKMAISLIDFINVFKNHHESYVRKSITICIHSILTNVPNYFLFEELQTDMLSFRNYLANLKQLDPESFHSHCVLVLFTLNEQLNDYQNKIKTDHRIKKIQI